MARKKPDAAEFKRRCKGLALAQMEALLDAEPRLAKAFAKLAHHAQLPRLKHFCREGESYTARRVDRLKEAFELLGAPARRRDSSGLDGLIKDALRAAKAKPGPATDAAIGAAIECISHFGLGAYTVIDRYLREAGEPKARRVLIPSTKEKRDAIREESRMARRRLLPRVRMAG